MPEIPPSPIPRRDVVDHVERAFDLLQHYRDALNHDGEGISVEDRERVLQQLEEVLRIWLPMALAANEPLITDVHAAIGQRDKAKQLLAAPQAELWQVRAACLQRLAREAHASPVSPVTAVANCREEIRRWRALLPHIRRRHDGQPYIERSDQSAALSVSYYWSGDLDSRPSRQGASYFLAAACETVAAAARHRHLSREAILPAVRLPLRLRRHPDWAAVEGFEVMQVLAEQMELIGGIEDLMAELDLAERPLAGIAGEPRPDGDLQAGENAAAGSANEQPAVAAPGAGTPADEQLTFDPVEKAIVLLLRDGKTPRSTRAYALEVGVSHTTLGRNERWKRAYESAKPGQRDLPEGTKDKDGNLEAWATEVCENCREEPIEITLVVNGESVRVCEGCAKKLAPRTKPRTS